MIFGLPALPLVSAAAYVCWMVYTSQAKYTLGTWGPDWLARAIDAVLRAILAGFGVALETVVDGDHGASKKPRTYIVAGHPHGAFPVAQIGLGMLRFRLHPPEHTGRFTLCAAEVLFWVPLLREFMLLGGCRSATRAHLRRSLKYGGTIVVNPGGNYEMTCTEHTQEQVFAQPGLGFVRLAMETGTPLLPQYAFGENQIFHTYHWLRSARLWLVRNLRLGAPLFTGRWGVPYSLFPVRGGHAITVVIGRAIEVGPPNASPSDEEVYATYLRYTDEVARIFATHGARYLPPAVAARGLRIQWIQRGSGAKLVREVKCA